MKRNEIASNSGVPHFIGCWTIEPVSLCNEIIGFFENHASAHSLGKMAGGLNLDAKNSTDLSIKPRDLDSPDHEPVRQYINALFECYKDYLEQWPFLQSVMSNVDIGSFNIQRYEPGGHFQKIHSERTTLGTSHRVLAWMTYLNDIEDGGATRFVHQDMNIQPQAGKTLIWPAEWTHAHQGQVVNAGTKYIITGWMHFAPGGS